MSNQQGQRRRCYSIDATGMADGAGPMRLKFLFRFVRQAGQRCVVKIFWQHDALVAAIRRDIGGLAREIYMVFGVDLDLFSNFAVEFAEARPDSCEISDRDMRI